MNVTAEDRVDLVTEFVGSLIDAGCTHHEVVKCAEILADIVEQIADRGEDPAAYLNSLEKSANLLPYLGSAVANAAGTIGNRALDFATGTAGKLTDRALGLSPWALGASIALPLGAGYVAGQGAGALTDYPDDAADEIKRQELLSLLRERADILNRRHLNP